MTAARRLFKVDPSPLRSSSPFAEISFCHFYVFRSGGAKDSAREFLSPIGAGRSFPWVRESNSFCLPPATEREKEYKDVCTSFMDLVGLRICDAFSIFIHPEKLGEAVIQRSGLYLVLQDQELLPDQRWIFCRISKLLLAQKLLLVQKLLVKPEHNETIIRV